MASNRSVYKLVLASDKSVTVYKLVTSTMTQGVAVEAIKRLCSRTSKVLLLYKNGAEIEKIYPEGYVKSEIRILDMDTGKVHKSVQSVSDACGLAPATVRHRLYLKLRNKNGVAYKEGANGNKKTWHQDTELVKFKDRFCIFKVYFVHENEKKGY